MQSYNVQGTLADTRSKAIQHSVGLWLNTKPFNPLEVEEVKNLKDWIEEMLESNYDTEDLEDDEVLDALEHYQSGFKNDTLFASDEARDVLNGA